MFVLSLWIKKEKKMILLFSSSFYNIWESTHDVIVAFWFVRKHTVTAVLNARFGVTKITSAVFSQGIQWAIAKKTVEIFKLLCLMAGKEFALLITEETIMFPLTLALFHVLLLFYCFIHHLLLLNGTISNLH